jgi:uncharacterized protein with NAD-binding domain and iron-sulfur cluster
MTTVAIFGGGVAGLTAAHELGERGYSIDLYEKLPQLGGKSRSFGKPGSGQGGLQDLPGEHGFRFYPGFYKHVPDTMSRIPLSSGVGTVADNLVDVPNFVLAFKDAPPISMPTNAGAVTSPEEWGAALINLFSTAQIGLDLDDIAFFAERILCALASCEERRAQQYEEMNWENYIKVGERGPVYKRVFSDGLARPLVAMDPGQTNARTALTVMIQILQNIIEPNQTADRILNGPTSEAWINHWEMYLDSMPNVSIRTGVSATEIVVQNNQVHHVKLATGAGVEQVVADYYIFAVPLEVMQGLLTPALEAAAPELSEMLGLTTSWMTGLVYYFSNDATLVNGHVIYADSPWALTSISPLPFWPNVSGSNIGSGNVQSVISTIISNWDKPGTATAKTPKQCTENELIAEVIAQLNQHLQNIPGEQLISQAVVDSFLDPAISFDNNGVVSGNSEPLLINTVGSYKRRPPPITQVQNLFLAGDYVRTLTNLATMEGACEAGRLAAMGILLRDGWSAGQRPHTFPLSESPIFDSLKFIDKTVNFPLGWGPPCPSSLDALLAEYAKAKPK